MKQLGNRIAYRRKKLGVKQNILAQKLGISNNHMSGIENGKEKPSLDLFVNICNELNVTPDFLLFGNMHSSKVPKDISDLLQLCSDEDIRLIQMITQHIANLRFNENQRDKIL